MDSPVSKSSEIWASRVQREIIALTGSEEGDDRSVLPSFVTVSSHSLDLHAGTASLHFAMETPEHINLSVDASMSRKTMRKKQNEGYPFAAPQITLLAPPASIEAYSFPAGSTLKPGDRIAFTDGLDWTPSLHLRDAMTHVALTLKERILQGEPLHGAPVAKVTSPTARLASSLGLGSAGKKREKRSPANKKKTAAAKEAHSLAIGDEINVLQEPWVDARGVYNCKALQRPPYVLEAMAKAEKPKESASSGSMFRSFTQSARSVLEESFLMITDTHIIEIKASKLQLNWGTVTFLMPIEQLGKLKFRRHESLSLFFKTGGGNQEPLVYVCRDSGDAVQQIQAVLKERHGVRGKHTNAAAYKAIHEAMQLVQEIQTKELALQHDPTVARVNDIMDLYRQAAERFESAGDVRHSEVVTHMRKFLALPTTTSILDGTYKRKEEDAVAPPSPQGEVLDNKHGVNGDDDDDDLHRSREEEKASDKAFVETMDSILEEAKEDLQKLGGKEATDGTEFDDSGLADVAADLDAMLKEADKELANLMKD